MPFKENRQILSLSYWWETISQREDTFRKAVFFFFVSFVFGVFVFFFLHSYQNCLEFNSAVTRKGLTESRISSIHIKSPGHGLISKAKMI